MAFLDLFKPKWKHADPDVREAAVNGIINQSNLVNIAKQTNDPNLKSIIINKIEDPNLFIKLALILISDENEYLREIISKKIVTLAKKEPKLIFKYWKSLSSQYHHEDNDMGVHRDISLSVHTDSYRHIDSFTGYKLPLFPISSVNANDHRTFLQDIAKKSPDWQLRKNAYKKLGNEQSVLKEIALNSESWIERGKAVDKLDNAELVIEVALALIKSAPDEIRSSLVEKIIKMSHMEPVLFHKYWNKLSSGYFHEDNPNAHSDRKPYSYHADGFYSDGGRKNVICTPSCGGSNVHSDGTVHIDKSVGYKLPQFPPNLQ